MLPATSIFRRMPGALALNLRRLLGAMAYANDGAELSFMRLKEAARAYRFPSDGLSHEDAGWLPANRLSIITDAWACIDHINRARKLVKRFPCADPRPVEIDPFLDATKPAAAIRNRLQHLDEDIFTGANCTEGNPILGAVSWADARSYEGHIRYSISSGPAIDGGRMSGAQFTDVDGAGDIVDFQLMAADQTVDLSKFMKALADFIGTFEVTVYRAVILGLRAGAIEKGISLKELRPHSIADMTMATRLRHKTDDGWKLDDGDLAALVEVAPGYFDISQPPS